MDSLNDDVGSRPASFNFQANYASASAAPVHVASTAGRPCPTYSTAAKSSSRPYRSPRESLDDLLANLDMPAPHLRPRRRRVPQPTLRLAQTAPARSSVSRTRAISMPSSPVSTTSPRAPPPSSAPKQSASTSASLAVARSMTSLQVSTHLSLHSRSPPRPRRPPRR